MKIDGVGIIAVLDDGKGSPRILLQKQFRPPVGSMCVEVPAGLIDAGETPEECAVCLAFPFFVCGSDGMSVDGEREGGEGGGGK